MGPSPGHKKWPQHKVNEEPVNGHVEIRFGEDVIGTSNHAIKVMEDKYPVRYYIPREDVNMDWLEPTSHTSECPFKGHASYYSIKSPNGRAENAVWSYEDPFDEHRDLKDRLAFYDDKVNVRVLPG